MGIGSHEINWDIACHTLTLTTKNQGSGHNELFSQATNMALIEGR